MYKTKEKEYTYRSDQGKCYTHLYSWRKKIFFILIEIDNNCFMVMILNFKVSVSNSEYKIKY